MPTHKHASNWFQIKKRDFGEIQVKMSVALDFEHICIFARVGLFHKRLSGPKNQKDEKPKICVVGKKLVQQAEFSRE